MAGASEMRRALKRAPAAARENIADAIEETVRGVHARGQANIRAFFDLSVPSDLLRNYRQRLNRKSLTGRVGYLTKAAAARAFYQRFLHDGTRYIVGRPFHQLAVTAERERDLNRMTDALDGALAKLSQRGPVR